ncbi:alpha-galactosidase [Verrucomicrobiaceae bacterium N1E253]|uniref:Alpha-galactosidase n=1 Tax=Oceaniferula marina TaxID=2748318 RepID=A0A851GFE9_9BACT|nr:alpha-galactosidase [Oceaniferula marina]NWK55632.1 alpha-galactosidase [Oceaniferula marina]
MKQQWIRVVGVMALGLCLNIANADEAIKIETQNYQFAYRVDKGRKIHLDFVGSTDGKWKSPLGGPLFSPTPCHLGNGPRYLSPLSVITSNGSNGLELSYQSHTLTESKPGVQYLKVVLKDSIHPITVELHQKAYRDENTFEQWLVLKNDMEASVQVPRLDSLYFRGNAKRGIHLEWYGSNEYHTAGEPFREKLNMGIRVLESRDGIRHKSGPIPAFVLGFGAAPDETKVPCMIAALEWPGSSKFSFEINERIELEASIGVNQSQPPVVEPGKSTASPHVIYSLSQAGMGAASRNLHQFARKHFLPGGDRLRPVDNNSWEGCKMNVTEDAIIQMMKDSAELGIELYVLDDGWFGNGSEARVRAGYGLGDWEFNEKRFPNGLTNIMKEAKKLDIEFGIWFEPEMVSPKSKLYKNKPEWVMKNPGRHLAAQRRQYVLDVANPEVQDHMFKVVNDVLSSYPDIRYVKWDANSNINNPYSPYLGAKNQGNMINAYNYGYLSVMKRLVEAHPKVDFMACGAGGGRANFGAMRYGHTFWPSDFTDPRYRLHAQWNFSSFMPPLAITGHVTHAGGGKVTPKFRFDVSMMGQLGMEVDTRKSSPDYLAAARTGIAAYKEIRAVVQQGNQYRHAHPKDSPTPSLNYVSQDQKQALILAFQTDPIKQPKPFNAPVSGLDEQSVYTVYEINLPDGDQGPRLAKGVNISQSGAAWMKSGVPLVFTRQWDSASIRFIKE